MSSGLSMASVNRIKEFAAAHEYSLAVEILDSQDLEKSLNPQFLAVCAEVYENVGRLQEARQLYVRSHIMAPQSNRILFCMENFYLKLGYFGLAEKYKEQILFNSASERGTLHASYIMDKARKVSPEQLFEMLYPYYQDNLDETWSFELYLISCILKKEDVADIVSRDYEARFKTNHHVQDIQDIRAGKNPEEFFWIYADCDKPDEAKDEKDLREEEAAQLIKDVRRMHPEEFAEEEEILLTEEGAVILAEEEASEPEEKESLEKGLKRFIKRRFRKKPKDEEEHPEGEAEEAPLEEKETAEASSEKEEASAEKEVPAETPEPEQPEESPAEVKPEEPQPVNDVVSVSFDDGFAPENESISELTEEENEEEIRSNYVFGKLFFQSASSAPAPEESGPEAAEPGTEPEIVEEPVSELEVEEEPESETEVVLEEAESETEEPGSESEGESEPEEEPQEEEPREEQPEAEPEVEEIIEPEVEEETESEVEEEAGSKIEEDSEPEVEEVTECEVEEEAGSEIEEESEFEIEEEESESEEEPASEPEAEEEPESETEEVQEKEPEASPRIHIPEEGRFRELSSDLFTGSRENSGSGKRTEQQEEAREQEEKLSKGLDEEARKLKETEELLASLGIKL